MVAILLCTYQGERFLSAQLESIVAQSYRDWRIWASDDNSSDSTLNILKEFEHENPKGKMTICSGPSKNSTANFLSLLHNSAINAEYYAYADQDDIWETDKLERAVNWLNTVEKNIPALYCSRTRLIDDRGADIGFSPLFSRPPSFRNALVQNIAGGNTMVFNDAARRLLQKVDKDVDIVLHDWWTYLVVTGCGGKVYYDPYPTIKYRQHQRNVVGAQNDWPSRIRRVNKLLHGGFRQYSESNIRALSHIRDFFTTGNKSVFDEFVLARKRGIVRRSLGLAKCRIYRQTSFGNFGLFIAVILNKI